MTAAESDDEVGVGSQSNVVQVGITQIASHPSLDAVRQGFVDGMTELGWVEGENIRYLFRNANRDPSLALPIAQDFVADNVNLIVPITTPSALAAAQATSQIPIVFGGVTDPVGVGLVPSLEKPGGNVTGTSDRWPFREQLELFVSVAPEMKCLGMLYAPGDEVSEIAVKEMKGLTREMGLTFDSVPISGAQDLYAAARAVLRRCDAIYTGLDTIVVENFESVLKAALESRKPVFAGDPESVKRGALATFGVSMEELGEETARLANRVLRGEDPGTIDVVIVRGGQPYINRSAAKEAGIEIPKELLESAIIVD